MFIFEGSVTMDGAAVADADVGFTQKGTDGIPTVGKTETPSAGEIRRCENVGAFRNGKEGK